MTVQDAADRVRRRGSGTVGSSLTRALQVLTDRRHRKAVVLGALVMIGLVAFGVYAIVAAPPPRVEAVVYFTPEATTAQKDAARAACPTVGGAVRSPPDRDPTASSRVYPLRYVITTATAADKAALYRCVRSQPGVLAISEFTQGQ